MLNTLYNEDCLLGMQRIPDGSVDMILCDLPYGTTCNKWDSIIPFEPLWAQYGRLAKKNAAIVLTAQTPFSITLGASNIKWLRYQWIWQKSVKTGFLNASRMPLKSHEQILVFYRRLPTYNPQWGEIRARDRNQLICQRTKSANYGKSGGINNRRFDQPRFPKDVLTIRSEGRTIHPTQKPVALFEYLIRTYTNPGEVVLDNAMGSGTTAIACLNSGRQYIGFEKDKTCFETAQNRIASHRINAIKAAA